MQSLSALCTLVMAMMASGVAAYPEGARCGPPDRGTHGTASSGDGGFGLTFTSLTNSSELTRLPKDEDVSVSLAGSGAFKGYQLSVAKGEFGSAPSGSKKLASCESDALTHSRDSGKSSVDVVFTAPAEGGTVTFKYYVMTSKRTWYGPLYTSIDCVWGDADETTPSPIGSTDDGSGAGSTGALALALALTSAAAVHAMA